VVTIGGMFWGILLFNEIYSIWVWFSLLIIILGVVLVAPRKKTKLKATHKPNPFRK
jgi:drug/metabolite transporter (DMT)-like permease